MSAQRPTPVAKSQGGADRAALLDESIYSYYLREVLSMGCVDLDASKIGTEVIVQWGDYGGRIKNVRATVARFPYITEGRNSDLNVKTIG